MACDSRNVLELLKAELAYLENGGYRSPVQAAWRPQLMFQDSPTCINFNSTQQRKPCGECALMQFVPENQRSKKIPCRYIPLDAKGETVDFFYRYGTQEELETVVLEWLKVTIARLEPEKPEDSKQVERPEVHVRARFANSH